MALKKQYCNSVQFYFLFLLLMSLLIVLAAFCLWGMLGTPQNKVKRILLMALDFSFLFFSISIIYLLIYNLSSRFQLMHIVSYNPRIFSIVLSADGLSLLLLTLTTLLIPICVLSSWKSIKHLVKEFIICLLLLEVALFLVFTVFDLLLFYIFFESTLIPMLLIIGIWGFREEKVIASYYFFFYTLVGSLFMLLSLFKLYSCTGLTDYFLLENIKIPLKYQNAILGGFFLSFSIKVPQIPFHIWLPQAHVEAPVSGSVILAGILLKLGGYGFLRIFWLLLPEASLFLNPLIISLAILSTVYGGLITCRQIDLKRLIAYSSVSHMGLVILGLFSHTSEGLMASVFLMLTHGVVSGALFIGVTYLYERHHTRIIKYYRGVVVSMPILAIIFFILSLSNIAFPPTGSFISELFSLLSVYSYDLGIGTLVALSMIISSTYTIYLYNRVFFGAYSNYLFYSRDLSRREFYLLLPMIVLIFFMGIFTPFLFGVLNYSLLFLF